MKHWSKFVAVGGFLLVLAWVAKRFSGVQTSWADLGDLAPDIASIGLFVVVIIAIFLAILWSASLLWSKIRGGRRETLLAGPQRSIASQWSRANLVGMLSVVLGIVAESLLKMHTPGWRIVGSLSNFANRLGFNLDLRFFLVSAVIVDAAICFAMLWGGYLLWKRSRRSAAQNARSTLPGDSSSLS
jgi:hypothetical protein